MAVTYSQDLRDRVLAAYDRGMETNEIAQILNVSASWARRVRQTRREEGRTEPLPRGGARFVKIDMDRLAELVREQPDATLAELQDRLGADCTDWAIGLALKRLNLTFKKNDPCGGAESARCCRTTQTVEGRASEAFRPATDIYR